MPGFWYSAPLTAQWGLTLLASANGQQRTDVDDDGWADLPKYARGRRAAAAVLGRPRRPDVLRDRRRHVGRPHRRLDAWRRAGASGRPLCRSAGYAARRRRRGVPSAVGTRRRHEHARVAGHRSVRITNSARPRSATTTTPALRELTVRRASAGTRWSAAWRSNATISSRSTCRASPTRSRSRRLRRRTMSTCRAWLAISASARLDRHNEFGTFVSPRISGLVRGGPWSSRVSYGTGFSAPTPLTEETEAAGLSRLTVRRSAEGGARQERVV